MKAPKTRRFTVLAALTCGLAFGTVATTGATAQAAPPVTAQVVSTVLPLVQPVAVAVIDTAGLDQTHTSGVSMG